MPLSAPAAPDAPLQRTSGVLRLAFDRAPGAAVTRLRTLYQEGAARARLPRVAAGFPPEAILLNTAGGLTGGDRMTTEITVESGAEATVTTQASERIYRSAEGETRVVNRLRVSEGASLEWLPQETILFDRARLDRALEVEIAADGSALLAEAVVFGRTAMGETVTEGLLRDRWRVRRNGRLVFADGVVIERGFGARLTRPVALEDGCAYATLLFVAPDAEERLDAVRTALGQVVPEGPPPLGGPRPTEGTSGDRAGASAWDGLLAVRIAARDGSALRAALVRALSALRQGRPLPTVWHC